MKKKNVLLTTFGTVAVCCLAIGGIKANINAAADVAAQTKDYFVYGGSVKINDARGSGVRFSVVMSESKFEEYGKIGEDGNGVLNAGVTTGTLLLPYELTNGNDLTVNAAEGDFGATVSDSDTSGIWKKTTVNGAAYMQSIVFLYNIPETDYGTEISVRGYIRNGSDYVYTEQRNEISMSYVAKAAYEDENFLLDDSQKAALKESYLDKTITYCVDGTVTTESVDYLGLLADCPIPAEKLDDGSEFVGWATKDGTIVKNVSSERVKNSATLYATYRRRLLMTDATITLPLDNYTKNGYTATGIKIGKYDLDTQADALKADTKSHGEQTAEVTLTKDSETFTAKLPVLLITKEIANAEDFKSIQPSNEVKGVYGYYVLTKDISDTGLSGNAYSGDWAETTGFFGTFDGQGNTIATAANGGNGMFGILRGATVKNLTIKDNWRGGYQSYALFAKACFNSIIENVTFEYAAGNTNSGVGNGYGWISYAEFSGNTLSNVTVNDNKGYGSLFGYKFANNKFDNVTINGTYTEMGHTADNKSVLYDEVTKVNTKTAVTLENRQDFILDGGETLLDLGEYNGLEILSVKTSYGDTLSGISSVAARKVLTDKQKHGEQNFIVTVLNADGTKVEITVPVTVITKSIKTMAELQDCVKLKYGATQDIYGYYILANSVDATKEDFKAVNASGGWEGSEYAAFRGVFDGRGNEIKLNNSASGYGLFGTIKDATIKDVSIIDIYNGSGALIARNAYNLTMEGVNIKITGGKVLSGENDASPVFGNQLKNSTLTNVTITSSIAMAHVFATQTDNQFKDVFVYAEVTGDFSLTSAEFPDGVTVKKN